jgi:biotin carboxyl carrier protein
MIFEVAIGERVRTVSVVRKGSVLHVDLDGHVHVVDARRVSDSVVSLLVQNGDGGGPTQSVDAAFALPPAPVRRGPGEGGGDFDVHLAGRTIPVQVRPAGAFGRQKKEGAGVATTGPQRVTAPMPGKVVKVLVKPGDAVQARQGLVVVEAMKMENELRASREGRVREVAVTEGQSVDAGAVLMIVD